MTSHAKPLAVILAGGQSRRMGGGDKTLLALKGRPLLSHIVARLKNQAQPIVLNANGDAARFAKFGLTVIPDRLAAAKGPLAGLHAGLSHAVEVKAEWVLTVPSDVPFLPADLARRLKAALGGGAAAIAASAGRKHPVIGLWHTGLLPRLTEACEKGMTQMHAWVALSGAVVVTWDNDPFLNLNSLADFQAAEAVLQQHAS